MNYQLGYMEDGGGGGALRRGRRPGRPLFIPQGPMQHSGLEPPGEILDADVEARWGSDAEEGKGQSLKCPSNSSGKFT